MNSRQIAVLAHGAVDAKKGIEPLLLDIRKLTDVAEYFLLVHGNSDRHVRAIADSVIEELRKKATKPLHVEGLNDATWVLIDYGAVIVHVFHHQTRKYYNLERLWGDAKVVKMKDPNERPAKKTRRSKPARNRR